MDTMAEAKDVSSYIDSSRIKERFRELMNMHPEWARGQAYIQAILDVGERWIDGSDDD